MGKYLLKIVTLFSLILCANHIFAQDEDWAKDANIQLPQAKPDGIDQSSAIAKISRDIQGLKKEVISLNKDLRLLEENMLFPSNTRYSVFVTINSGRFFKLESVKVKLDGRFVASHIYSDKQRGALLNGGVQKLYVTNLNEGEHRITAFFTGIGFNERVYKRAANLDFKKGPGSQYLELLVTDDETTQEPVFKLNQW